MAATLIGAQNLPAGMPGGSNAWLNVTAAQVIKPAPGFLVRLFIVAAGTGGVITFNDCTTVVAAAAANEIHSIPNALATAGAIFTFEWPCGTGIVLSAVPTGSPQLSISFT